MEERLEAVLEVGAVHERDGDDEQELGERQRHGVRGVGEHRRHRPVEHVPHADVEERHPEDERDSKPRPHGVRGGLELLGGGLEPRRRSGSRSSRGAARGARGDGTG